MNIVGENVEGRLRSTFRVVRQKQGLSSQWQALAVASAVTEHAAQVNVRASSECAEPRPSSRLRRLLSRPLWCAKCSGHAEVSSRVSQNGVAGR